MSELDQTQQRILLACLANSHGAYEFKFLGSFAEKQAVAALIKLKLINREMGDGTHKGFTSRLRLTLRGQEIASKLDPIEETTDEEEEEQPA